MSELIEGDESWFPWPEHFLSKLSTGLDWSFKDQQIVPIPIIVLDDGRVAFQSENGQICLLDGLQGVGGVEDVFLPLSSSLDTTVELPSLSDATIKSMLVPNVLDAELPLMDPDMPDLASKDLQDLTGKDVQNLTVKDIHHAPVDDDFKALVSFRCQFCSFSSTDVPSLMHHSQTEHVQPNTIKEHSQNSLQDIDKSLSVISKNENLSVQEIRKSLSSTLEKQLTADVAEVNRIDLDTNKPLGDIVEHFVYLCSECNEGFTSVNECRDHMIKDHNMTVFDEVEKEALDIEKDVEVLPPSSLLPAVAAECTPPRSTPTPPTLLSSISMKLSTKSAPKLREYDPEFEAKPHKCREAFCVHKFRTLSCLELHVECHTQEYGHRFCCPHCSTLFMKWGQCALHMWKDHKIDVDLYTCSVCNEYKTTTRRKLDSHVKIHSEERPYKCSECGKGFKQRTQLINHKNSVHNKDKTNAPKWYMTQKCEICFKTYADSKCLKKHMQAVHSKLKPYKCQICGHMSARKAMLQAHMRQHTGEKPFACEQCAFRTGDHNSLRRHIMRHTGKRPYWCPHCSYSSIQSSSFKSHLQTQHPGQSGSYTCNECYFATVSEPSFKKHLSDHKLNLIPPNDVEVFPENVAAAHLVYRSFGTSPSQLHCNVTGSTTSRDRMKQTITISIPSGDNTVTDDEDTTHCFLPGDELDRGGITIPAEPEGESQSVDFDSTEMYTLKPHV